MHIAKTKILLALFMLALFQFPLLAKSKGGVTIQTVGDDDSGNPEDQWQVLEWEDRDSKYVYRYDVVIEELSAATGEWKQVNVLETKGNETRVQVQPFLYPGVYHFKVITYDLFGFPSVESEWYDFNIYQAFVPEIKDVGLELYPGNTFYMDEENDGVVTVNGKNLFTESEGETDINYTEYFLVYQGKKSLGKISPVVLEHDDKNSKLKIQFDMDTLDVGKYNLVARDASGLESERTSSNSLNVKYKKAVDFDLSGGYALPICLFDDTLPKYFETRLMPLSLTGKANLMPIKHTWGYLGVGLSGFYSFQINMNEEYTVSGNLISGFVNAVYQLPIFIPGKDGEKRRHIATLEGHGGVGVTLFANYAFDFPYGIRGESMNNLCYSVDVGGSFQLYVTNRIFVEASLDYITSLGDELALGLIIPSASIGFQF